MKNFMMTLFVVSVLASGSNTAVAADLTVELSNLRNKDGNIQLAIYDNAAHFQNDTENDVFMVLSGKVTSKNMTYTIHDVPEGRYAITAIHDENGNNELDMSERTPLEGLAYSGTKSRLTKPSFERAATELSDQDKTIRIKLNYYNF